MRYFQVSMYDAKAAVRRPGSNSSTCRIDAERTASGGGSAGAVTALMVACTQTRGEGSSCNPVFI